MKPHPGSVKTILSIDLPYPRQRTSPDFSAAFAALQALGEWKNACPRRSQWTGRNTESLEAEFRREYRAGRGMEIASRLVLNVTRCGNFLVIWEAVPWLFPWINKVMFPPPSQVFAAFWPMIKSGEIPYNILVSIRRASIGFEIAAIAAIVAGVFTARLRVANYLTEPLLHGFHSVPVIALVPVSVLWFGIGEGAKIALVATGAFFPIWIATFIGVRDVHKIYLRSAACLGAGSPGDHALRRPAGGIALHPRWTSARPSPSR